MCLACYAVLAYPRRIISGAMDRGGGMLGYEAILTAAAELLVEVGVERISTNLWSRVTLS